MTSVTFFENDGKLTGFGIEGHACGGEYGEDIVCSAISSAAIMTVNTVTDIMKIPSDAKVGEGSLSLTVSEPDSAQQILRGFEQHIKQLVRQYPENMTVSYRR